LHEHVDNQSDMVKLVSKHFPKLAHRITLLLFAIWRQKWDFSNKTKACDHLICRLLTVFNIEFGGVNGNLLEHLEGILGVIKEILNNKK
jgi:hypothetical protein